MIENLAQILSTYGILGIWTGYMIYKEATTQKELITAIQNLTISIERRN